MRRSTQSGYVADDAHQGGVVARTLAEDLLLLCWDDERGVEHRLCWRTVDVGVAGALVAEAVLTGAVTIREGRLFGSGTLADDPLLGEVTATLARRPRPPRVRTLVDALATPRTTRTVRDRLVAEGVLAARRRRVLAVVPTTRFPAAAPEATAAVRDEIAALVTGQRDPGDAGARQRVLVGLAHHVKALPRLVSASQRPAAEERAAGMSPRDEVVSAVEASADRAQAILVAGG